MQPETLKSILAYIEQNLRGELDHSELARMAGYSTYHFSHAFAMAMGESLQNYFQKRRLIRATQDIAAGQKAIDVVLSYGYDTYAGFYKAFVRMYGCGPTRYLRIHAAGLPAIKHWRDHLMPTKAELRALLANWPIDQRLRIQPIPILHGERMSDTSFGVGDEFVLKLYTDRATLTRVLTITRALEAQGLKAASPIMTRDKQAFVEGDTLAALLRRVPGEPLPMAERYGARLEDCAAKTGQALARLHLALKAIESDIPADEANLYRTCEDWALPIARKQDAQWNLGLGDAFFGDYVSGFEALCGAMPRQLIHRDPNPSNILFSAGEVCGFIDFDLYERNVRLFDPCYSATGILSESGDDPQRYEKWPGILHGYDAVSPLTDEEKRAVYYVLCSIQMIFCAYCAEFEDATMQQLAATNRRMLTFIVSKRESIERMF